MTAPRRGFRALVSMRHDGPEVEALAASVRMTIGRLTPIDHGDLNPHPLREVVRQGSGLVASTRERGAREPLVVRPCGGRFPIAAGERWWRAAVQAALRGLPVVQEVDDTDGIELDWIETLPRNTLTPAGAAEALEGLAEDRGDTREDRVRCPGKPRMSGAISSGLKASSEVVRTCCRLADISATSLLSQVVTELVSTFAPYSTGRTEYCGLCEEVSDCA